jgi:tRNA threonylcarbamoyladenosine modification (KEOPS) complex Cgi121 subunit
LREGQFHSACWEVEADPAEIEPLLAKTREKSPGVILQVVGAERAPNPRAVELIAAQTLSATRSGATLAEKPELDLLLRLAGTRQIGEAFARVGYKSSAKRLFMVAACEGGGAALRSLSKRLAGDGRFKEVPRTEMGEADLDMVERAALLSAGL